MRKPLFSPDWLPVLRALLTDAAVQSHVRQIAAAAFRGDTSPQDATVAILRVGGASETQVATIKARLEEVTVDVSSGPSVAVQTFAPMPGSASSALARVGPNQAPTTPVTAPIPPAPGTVPTHSTGTFGGQTVKPGSIADLILRAQATADPAIGVAPDLPPAGPPIVSPAIAEEPTITDAMVQARMAEAAANRAPETWAQSFAWLREQYGHPTSLPPAPSALLRVVTESKAPPDGTEWAAFAAVAAPGDKVFAGRQPPNATWRASEWRWVLPPGSEEDAPEEVHPKRGETYAAFVARGFFYGPESTSNPPGDATWDGRRWVAKPRPAPAPGIGETLGSFLGRTAGPGTAVVVPEGHDLLSTWGGAQWETAPETEEGGDHSAEGAGSGADNRETTADAASTKTAPMGTTPKVDGEKVGT